MNLATHFYENCAEHQEHPKEVAFDGFIPSSFIQFSGNQANTLLVRSLCPQAMTLIVVTAQEE
jgi:hypothetical protein